MVERNGEESGERGPAAPMDGLPIVLPQHSEAEVIHDDSLPLAGQSDTPMRLNATCT